MSIRFGTPPPGAIQNLQRELGRLEAAISPDTLAAGIESINAADGVELFVLKQPAMEQGRGLAGAEQVGWRIRTAPGTVAEMRSFTGDEYRLAHIETSQLAASFDAVIDESAPIAGLPDGDYELRALLVPEFALMCAWLHGELDFIVPLPGSFYLEVWTAYAPNDLIRVLRDVAASRQRYPQ